MDIVYAASFGDHDKRVVLSRLQGGYYHIYVDNFYWGQVGLQNGKWEVLLQDPDMMSYEDKEAISDMITKAELFNPGL